MSNKYLNAVIVATLCGGVLQGCLKDEAGSGQFSLGVTDAPVDSASNVFVQFSGVELKGKDTHTFTFDEPKKIDLLTLQGSASLDLVDNVSLPSGKYQWIRLMVDTASVQDTYIVLDDGSEHELTIPGGLESGLKLVRGFSISENGNSNFTVDFDVRKSVVESNNGYHLKPALRITDNLEIGHIKGSVSPTLFANSCTAPVVYAFEGQVTPIDISGTTTDPVTTSLVSLDDVDSSYKYELGFLEAGIYTLGLTCESANDNVEAVDTINFISTVEATVEAKTKTTQDFL